MSVNKTQSSQALSVLCVLHNFKVSILDCAAGAGYGKIKVPTKKKDKVSVGECLGAPVRAVCAIGRSSMTGEAQEAWVGYGARRRTENACKEVVKKRSR